MAVTRPTVLVLRALGLGDLLTAVPAIRGVRRAFPAHRLVLAAPRPLAPLVALVGGVGEHVAAGALAPLPGAGRPDVAVNLHGRGPESHRVLLATRPRRLVAFAHADVPTSRGLPAWWPGEHEVGRWCRLLVESGVPADPDDLDVGPPAIPAPARAAGATVVHPGAASAARRWPVARWAEVARAEVADGRRVVVTGSRAEADLAGEVVRRARLPRDASLAGRLDLAGLVRVVASAARVVCGDTGVAHVATATRTPSVVLFGPVPPHEWGPPAGRSWHRALWAGRTGDPHGSTRDPGLLEIGVVDVLLALHTLPRRVPGRGAAPGPCPAPDQPRRGADVRRTVAAGTAAT